MALQQVYEKFLASPNPLALTEKAQLSYVTTLTTLREPGPIIKHLEYQDKSIVKKKGNKVISTIEGQDALAIEVETILEFLSGGGAYLPGIDNFVVDKIAIFPTTHIVHFDGDQRIKQIRVSWDQGALLKQVGIIGSSGRNWPICDGKDQARLIAGAMDATVPDTKTERGRNPEQVTVATRNVSPSKKRIVDPYASLAKTGFAPIESEEQGISSPSPVPRSAAKSSAKPPPRDFGDLFVGGDDMDTPKATARPVSPGKKENVPLVLPPKGGGNHKFQASRLFGESPLEESPATRYKSDPRKYSHFEVGHGDRDDFSGEAPRPASSSSNQSEKQIPMRAPTNKHLSQWDFQDFSTPVKAPQKIRAQDARHHGWSDDEGELASSPGKHPEVVKPRRDADTHFQMRDEATPAAEKTRPVSQSSHNNNMGLYENHIYNGEESNESNEDNKSQPEVKQPLSTVTNVNHRKKDFDAHWAMDDDKYENTNTDTTQNTNNENRPATAHHESQMKHIKVMEANWGNYDNSPENQKKEPLKPSHKQGKQAERHWGFGDDEEGVTQTKNKPSSGHAKSFWEF